MRTDVKKYFSDLPIEIYFLTFVLESPIIYNMKDYQKKPWTQDERQLLRDNYGRVTMKTMLDLLPGRSENSIRKQVHYLRKRGWSFNG